VRFDAVEVFGGIEVTRALPVSAYVLFFNRQAAN
jgi:hypothetical protein